MPSYQKNKKYKNYSAVYINHFLFLHMELSYMNASPHQNYMIKSLCDFNIQKCVFWPLVFSSLEGSKNLNGNVRDLEKWR